MSDKAKQEQVFSRVCDMLERENMLPLDIVRALVANVGISPVLAALGYVCDEYVSDVKRVKAVGPITGETALFKLRANVLNGLAARVE